MSKYFDGLTSFAQEDGVDKVFTFWVYRQVYTPYEVSQRFTDESIYEDIHGNFGVIRDIVRLDGDYLIGIVQVFPDDDYEVDEENLHIEYYPLSRLHLAYDPNLVNEEYEEDYDYDD